ncbi:AMP-binding protein [Candidatus Kirkpatrickella diaphorinae]|uniref:AMP-binding protein n=1 Tax=Candidatus Kirkpatrickella diaphorinae TaxID=2984322 RepID=A0ABY6GJC0_9PROT|nr:AMP-binding protein [Candidatus Kirkpatrickella diaphorinae]UYH51620.1 AMP-binding protein [Candidatus Kirkpatrickella diaphorinae]
MLDLDLAPSTKPLTIDGITLTAPIGGMLSEWARKWGSRIALVHGDDSMTFAALDRRVDRLAGALQNSGLKEGDRILIQMPNSIGLVTTLLAALRLGVTPIMAMPAQRLHDLSALVANAQPVAYFAARELHGFQYEVLARSLQQAHPCLRLIVLDGTDVPEDYLQLSALDAPFHPVQPPALTDLALLLLSGGTTGTPKLIPRTHADYAFTFLRSAEMAGVDEITIYLAILPGAHNFILSSPGILGVLSHGGRVVLANAASCDEIMPLIARESVTHIALVPPLLRLWIEARTWESSDLSSLRLLQIGGARVDAALVKQAQEVFGTTIQQVYGMAEGLICYTRLNDAQHVILNTQGRPMSQEDDIMIVDMDGHEVAPGETGELLTRGPYTISNYYKAAAQNAASFTAEGYYRTGDLVCQDADGNITVMGRIKEQINRAGEKIAAAEVEAALTRHPDIEEAVVVAAPDPHLGERTCAFLKGPSRTLPDLAIREFLRKNGMEAYKIPDQYAWITHWPQTAVGKLDRKKLVALAQKRDG